MIIINYGLQKFFIRMDFLKKMTRSSIEFQLRKNKKNSRNFKTRVILKILNEIQKIPSPSTRPRDHTASPALKPYP